jgi:hypothetical protein
MNDITIAVYKHSTEAKMTVTATFTESLIPEMILRLVVEKIAERYVEERYLELIAKLDQGAIANLAVAEASKKIAEEIRMRPVVIREPGNTVNNFSLL